MDNENYVLIFENPDEEMRTLITEIKPLCIEDYTVHSSAGIETVNIIVNICELLILFVQYPLLMQRIEDRKIVAKFNGFDVSGTPNKIIKKVKQNPTMLKALKKAYKNRELELKGEVGSVEAFNKKLRVLLDIKAE